MPAATTRRVFTTGATRNLDDNKIDYEGFLSPLALEAFGNYMMKHSKMEDGTRRSSDNWQLGIPNASYIKSAWRHLVAWWKAHRGYEEDLEEALCGLIFNAMGRLHNLQTERHAVADKVP